MERYHFFTSSCNQFRLRMPSLAQMHRDESEMDGTLANTLKTLKAIHHEFFNGHRGKVSYLMHCYCSSDCRSVGFDMGFPVVAGPLLTHIESDVECLIIASKACFQRRMEGCLVALPHLL